MERLIAAAFYVRENACCTYSHFKVGAALEDASGRIHTGCNIENSSYGLTVCAERVALWKALSGGARQFRRIVVAADGNQFAPPCGACRQILWEFCGNIEIVIVNSKGERKSFELRALFPEPFDDKIFR